MKHIFLVAFLINLSFVNFCSADGPDAKDKAKIILAKQKLYAGRYNEALASFKEILINNPTDGNLLYYIGLCHYNLTNYTSAQSNFEKAKTSTETNKETYYYLGQIYLKDGSFDNALTEFNTFQSKISEKESDIDYNLPLYFAYCNNAKNYMAKPVDVTISNIGTAINTKYDDKSPCITADGQKLVFNSRRPETTDSPLDLEGDGKFFEDIYISTWDSASKKWNDAEPLQGKVNTIGHDGVLSISPDGKQIFIYLNDPSGESRGGDIYVSRVNGSKWKIPEALDKPINTSYWEGGACISPDGKTLFFVSENPRYGKEKNQGVGTADIWMVTRISKTEWGKPVNLGPEVNSPNQEVGIFLAPDGKTLFFCSNNKESMGDYDIFKTSLTNGKWSKPVNLGFPINSERRDGPFVLSADPKTGYFSSDRKGGLGETDIYKVDLSNYSVLETDMIKKSNNEMSILRGKILDGFQGTGIEGIEFKIIDENQNEVASVNSDSNGEYFITLKGGANYKIQITHKGYIKIEENITLPLGKEGNTFTLEKQFLLNREK